MKAKIWQILFLLAVAAQAQMAVGSPKFVGNITTSNAIRPDFGKYWNQITAENECKWGSIQYGRNNWNWSGCDTVYKYAKKNGIPFKMHNLIWGAQYPTFMDSISTAAQLTAITNWMDSAVAHYPNADMIDVVNEAIPGHNPAPYKAALGGDGTSGYDWVIAAFKMARQRWPHTILVYNDFNVIQWNTDQYIALMKAIKPSGYVDAMGFQSHGLETLDSATLRKTIARVHDSIGLPIVISEYDLSIQDDNQQKTVMSEQFPIFWNTSYIAGITLWGYVESATWETYSGLMDASGNERSALTWLKSYVSSHLNVTSPIDWSNLSGPKFTTPNTISMKENIALVTTIAATVSSGTVTYAIAGGADAALFSLDATSHALSFKKAPLYDSPADSGKNNVYNVNVSATSAGKTTTLNLAITIQQPQKPYGGTAAAIPGTIEAENYDMGGQGVAYSVNDTVNHGGLYRTDDISIGQDSSTKDYFVGWTSNGEWLDYTVNVANSGAYNYTARVASAMATGRFSLTLDGTPITDTIAVPNTGSFNTFVTVTGTTPSLTAGAHTLKLTIDTAYLNIDWIRFDAQGTTKISREPKVAQNQAAYYRVFDVKGNFQYQCSALPQQWAQGVWLVASFDKQGNRMGTWIHAQQ